MSTPVDRFWLRKTLPEMTSEEWESLCDGCGRCCLLKLEDEDDGRIYTTDVGCRLLDKASCRCGDYANRRERVPDCIQLTPELATALPWLPPSCAYRLVASGQDLPWWHPLVSGRPETVIEAGISAAGRVAASENEVKEEDLPEHILSWPQRWPRKARGPVKPRSEPPRSEQRLPLSGDSEDATRETRLTAPTGCPRRRRSRGRDRREAPKRGPG